MSSTAAEPKPSRRRANRIAAMQFLYSWEANPGQERAEALHDFFSCLDHPRDYYGFAEELVSGVLDRQGEIDDRIRTLAANWDFRRIARVDLAILRLSVYELLFRNDIPPVVSINEAIDLGKAYSSEESKRFINGLLDRIKETLQRPLRSSAGEEDPGF